LYLSRVDNCEVFAGRMAGERIQESIHNAKKSITIVSPYLTPDYVDMLLQKQAEGVSIKLLTGTDLTSRYKRDKAYRKLIRQTTIINNDRLDRRNRLTLLSTTIIILSIILGLLGVFTEAILMVFWLSAFIAAPILVFALKMKYTHYEYKPQFEMGIIISPYEENLGELQYFVHSKIYVIDESIAFMGSVNFTEMGFVGNYECWTRINHKSSVDAIQDEVNRLFQQEKPYFADLKQIGAFVYEEVKPGKKNRFAGTKYERIILRYKIPALALTLFASVIAFFDGSWLALPLLAIAVLTVLVSNKFKKTPSG
jgi:phosphatidylserine/phosphatidylglycerophosphate/cardiolipin synthase-like enzyme